MNKLFHYPLDPFCRRIRLSLAESGTDIELVEEKPWDARVPFLQLNPTGQLPVMVLENDDAIAGIDAVAGHIEDALSSDGKTQFGNTASERAEVRRLVSWFDDKFYQDVSAPLLIEKVVRRFVSKESGGGAPNMARVRAALDRIRPHLDYIGQLTQDRSWLACDEITAADFAAAGHLSMLDYLGDVPWSANKDAKAWYQRIKSRPSFRSLLSDKIQGMPPPRGYSDLDF